MTWSPLRPASAASGSWRPPLWPAAVLRTIIRLGQPDWGVYLRRPGAYANPVSLLPPGTDAEVQAEARPCASGLQHSLAPSGQCWGGGRRTALTVMHYRLIDRLVQTSTFAWTLG